MLVDMGCRLGDYCSDQTRTFWVGGEPSDRFRHVLGMVQEAQEAAMKIMRPGLPMREAYGAARSVFERYGQAQYFTHSLGHGIGLETHEPPSLSPLSEDVLEPGMVVSVEPGLYYPDCVITSYSIHYTKLYEAEHPARDRRPGRGGRLRLALPEAGGSYNFV